MRKEPALRVKINNYKNTLVMESDLFRFKQSLYGFQDSPDHFAK